MSINNSAVCVGAPQLKATMTGSTLLIGTLTNAPAIVVFDNLGTVAVDIYINQTTTIWKTFAAGSALVLDLRAAQGLAPNFTFAVGTSFFGNGASGDFSISYVYAQA